MRNLKYMITSLRILCCILLLGLFGCSHNNALKKQEIAQCQQVCVQHFEFCKNNCVNNCPTCSWASTRSSVINFTKYVNEQKVQGKKVMRELNSYRDPLQCRKVTCDCLADLSVCKQSCSGVVRKRVQVVPNCV